MQTQNIDLTDTVERNQAIVASDMDGEKVMLNLSTSKYYNLGSVGGAIWEQLSTPTSVATLVTKLTAIYSVDRETCSRDIVRFLRELCREQLILCTAKPE
ncbi:MAG: lasso peptide biosynthesis PqqD family chaperone [Sporolactobacillus sp.]